MDQREIGYIDTAAKRVFYPFAKRDFQLKPEEEIRLLMVRRLIEEYKYQPEQIGLELAVKAGSSVLPKRADIIVFAPDQPHDPAAHAYIVVEVKKKDRTDGVDQMQTYCNNTTATFGVWFNGADIVYQHRRRKPHDFLDIPDIPQRGESLDDVGEFRKADLVPATELKSVFETIHNHIYANEGLLKEKVFTEMLKIIFMKMIDEKRLDDKCAFRITESELRDIERGGGAGFVGRVDDLFIQVKREYGDVFSSGESISLRPTTLGFVVSRLQKYDLQATEADVKGVAFQTFVSAHQRGERGEFFTPHPVLELMVEMMDPGPTDRVLDPACGSGGFLVYAMSYVWDKFRARKGYKAVDLLKYAHTYIRGLDFNPDLAKVAKMYMVLYDDGHTGVFSANALERWSEIKANAADAGVTGVEPGAFDVILTNPPFGSKGKVTDKRLLAQFDLARAWKRAGDKWQKTTKLRDGQVPDILFIERCLEFLDEGGRMGIVLPNSDLNNSSLEYVRRYILSKARILAVVSLPMGTFMSSGANPQPSVLFLQRTSDEKEPTLDYPIFMAAVSKIGFDLTTKTAPPLYQRDSHGEVMVDSEDRPLLDTDIPRTIQAFREFRRRHQILFHPGERI